MGDNPGMYTDPMALTIRLTPAISRALRKVAVEEFPTLSVEEAAVALLSDELVRMGVLAPSKALSDR